MEFMRMRAYPISDFEQRAADLSINYPDIVTNYRAAHAIALKNKDGRLVACTVTSPGSHCLRNNANPLVACDSHSDEKIEAGYKRWQSRLNNEPESEPENQ